ncbi:MAG: glycosyltransferase family 4 protein [Nitrospira sp.]|nr:glycosyltransferase family 4 protein [Nitrospira sp.]
MKALADLCSVTLCVNCSMYPLSDRIDPRIRVVDLKIVREVSLFRDLRALLFLLSVFRREKFSAVHSITPKAGLLAMFAARFAGIRFRHHTFTGQVWANRSGIVRYMLKTFDRLIVQLASNVFTDSPSQCRFLEEERVVGSHGISVLGPGSISGVDVCRFRPDTASRHQVRTDFGVDEDRCVFLFVGRLTKDKGIHDLVQAFAKVSAANPRVELWLVGPDEEELREQLSRKKQDDSGLVRWLGATSEPERYMASADVLVLPSYREGFGSVIIEAAACAIPTVAYRIDGVIDAVVEERTGVLVEVGDIEALAAAMLDVSRDWDGRQRLGREARDRVSKEFSSTMVTAEWVALYKPLL